MKIDNLVGEIINKAHYNGSSIYLDCVGSVFELTPDADCCADCYINDVNCSEVLSNATILEIESLYTGDDLKSSPGDDEEAENDYIDVWGVRIHTTKGICTIGMRTRHNGCYVGRLECSKVSRVDLSMPLLIDF